MASVDVIINTITKGSEGAISFAQKLGSTWAEIATPVNQTLEIMEKVQRVAGQAFDALERGAQVNQTAESFARLNAEVWQTPNLLQRMTEASRGTISEFDLMRGLLTLTAGAGEDMSRSFAEAAPGLLEIAKAANKLNPTLGDTSFLYESIATGIKRQSPLILDNLGLVVKVGEANEAYASQLGKSVDELSAMEKQQALLNEVLRSGGELIKQVGGDVTSQTDAYQRFNVVLQETADAVKVDFAEAIAPNLPEITASIEELGPALADVARLGVPAVVDLAEALPPLISRLATLAGYADTVYDVSRLLFYLTNPVGIAAGAGRSFQDFIDGATPDTSGVEQLLEDRKRVEAQLSQSLSGAELESAMANYDFMMRAQTQSAQGAAEAQGQLADGVLRFSDFMNQAAGPQPLVEANNEIAMSAEAAAIAQEELERRIAKAVELEAGAGGDEERRRDMFRELNAAASDFTVITQEQIEAENALIEREKELEEAARRRIQAQSGDDYTAAVERLQDREAPEFNLADELYEVYDAAGVGAAGLALFDAQVRELDDGLIEAALKAQTLDAVMRQVADQVAAGEIDPVAGFNAIKEFQTELENTDFTAVIHPEIAFEEAQARDQLKQKLAGILPEGDISFDAGAVAVEGSPDDIVIGVVVDPDAESIISGFIDGTLAPYAAETYTTTVDVLYEDALTKMDEVISKQKEIERDIKIEITTIEIE